MRNQSDISKINHSNTFQIIFLFFLLYSINHVTYIIIFSIILFHMSFIYCDIFYHILLKFLSYIIIFSIIFHQNSIIDYHIFHHILSNIFQISSYFLSYSFKFLSYIIIYSTIFYQISVACNLFFHHILSYSHHILSDVYHILSNFYHILSNFYHFLSICYQILSYSLSFSICIFSPEQAVIGTWKACHLSEFSLYTTQRTCGHWGQCRYSPLVLGLLEGRSEATPSATCTAEKDIQKYTLTVVLRRLLSLKIILTLSCWYSFESFRWVLSGEYPFARVSVIFQVFLHHFILAKLATCSIRVNPFNAETSFVRGTRTQRSLKIIWSLSCGYSLESSHWVITYEYPFARVSVIFQPLSHYFVLTKLATS